MNKLQARRAFSVTPNDTEPLQMNNGGTAQRAAPCIYVGTTGDVRVLTEGGDEVTFKNIIGGSFVPVQIQKVFATGTTASDIIALY